MRIFISYARADKPKAALLSDRLTRLGHETWLDERLSGGQDWWGRILHQIRTAEAMALVLSPDWLRSQACAAERTYATELGKTLLPVMSEPVSVSLLPLEVARLQVVDYLQPGEDAALALASASAQLRASPPLPEPLPPPPDVPLSYLSHLGQRLGSPALAFEDQLDIVTRLETGLRAQDGEERSEARRLAEVLRGRSDLYAETERRLDRIAMSGKGNPAEAARPEAGGDWQGQPAAQPGGPQGQAAAPTPPLHQPRQSFTQGPAAGYPTDPSRRPPTPPVKSGWPVWLHVVVWSSVVLIGFCFIGLLYGVMCPTDSFGNSTC